MQNLPFEFSHGGYIKEQTGQQRTTLRTFTTETIDVETDLDYLFPDSARDPNSLLPADNNQDIIDKLKKLGEAIIDREVPETDDANSIIPPVYTYWGQFIDHDITANTDRAVTDLQQLLKQLAKRNLLRRYFLSIPTGQSLADKLGIKKLTVEELKQGNSPELNEALEPFLEKTPAWYYVLKESEVRANGDSLGEVGSRIVGETIIGLIKNDPFSYLNEGEHDWNPSKGVKLPNGGEIRAISDFLEFAGVLPTS